MVWGRFLIKLFLVWVPVSQIENRNETGPQGTDLAENPRISMRIGRGIRFRPPRGPGRPKTTQKRKERTRKRRRRRRRKRQNKRGERGDQRLDFFFRRIFGFWGASPGPGVAGNGSSAKNDNQFRGRHSNPCSGGPFRGQFSCLKVTREKWQRFMFMWFVFPDFFVCRVQKRKWSRHGFSRARI